MPAKRPSHSTLMLNDTPLSRASPLPHFELNAPRQGTMNRNRARQPIQNSACTCKKTHIAETQKPRITGLSGQLSGFLLPLVKNWHAPCNSPISDSIHYPVSGTLVQAGRGFPSLHRAHAAMREPIPFWGPWYRQAGDSLFTPGSRRNARAHPVLGTLVQAGRGFPLYTRLTPQCASPSRFGDLGTGRPGIPSLHRAHAAMREPIPFWGPWYRQAGDSLFTPGSRRNARALLFWGPWYRQAGDSLFYCSRRWISSRQRSSTSLPAHSPCSGRAATTVSNNPPSLNRVRQFTSLPLSFS